MMSSRDPGPSGIQPPPPSPVNEAVTDAPTAPTGPIRIKHSTAMSAMERIQLATHFKRERTPPKHLAMTPLEKLHVNQVYLGPVAFPSTLPDGTTVQMYSVFVFSAGFHGAIAAAVVPPGGMDNFHYGLLSTFPNSLLPGQTHAHLANVPLSLLMSGNPPPRYIYLFNTQAIAQIHVNNPGGFAFQQPNLFRIMNNPMQPNPNQGPPGNGSLALTGGQMQLSLHPGALVGNQQVINATVNQIPAPVGAVTATAQTAGQQAGVPNQHPNPLQQAANTIHGQAGGTVHQLVGNAMQHAQGLVPPQQTAPHIPPPPPPAPTLHAGPQPVLQNPTLGQQAHNQGPATPNQPAPTPTQGVGPYGLGSLTANPLGSFGGTIPPNGGSGTTHQYFTHPAARGRGGRGGHRGGLSLASRGRGGLPMVTSPGRTRGSKVAAMFPRGHSVALHDKAGRSSRLSPPVGTFSAGVTKRSRSDFDPRTPGSSRRSPPIRSSSAGVTRRSPVGFRPRTPGPRLTSQLARLSEGESSSPLSSVPDSDDEAMITPRNDSPSKDSQLKDTPRPQENPYLYPGSSFTPINRLKCEEVSTSSSDIEPNSEEEVPTPVPKGKRAFDADDKNLDDAPYSTDSDYPNFKTLVRRRVKDVFGDKYTVIKGPDTDHLESASDSDEEPPAARFGIKGKAATPSQRTARTYHGQDSGSDADDSDGDSIISAGPRMTPLGSMESLREEYELRFGTSTSDHASRGRSNRSDGPVRTRPRPKKGGKKGGKKKAAAAKPSNKPQDDLRTAFSNLMSRSAMSLASNATTEQAKLTTTRSGRVSRQPSR